MGCEEVGCEREEVDVLGPHMGGWCEGEGWGVVNLRRRDVRRRRVEGGGT